MSVDLSGGFDHELELVFATQPDDPEMRESVNAWIWDDSGELGVPRIGIEAVADQWETHDVNVNMAFADGRVFTLFAAGRGARSRGLGRSAAHPRRRRSVL